VNHCPLLLLLLLLLPPPLLQAIESATGQRTCIVYGALPAETRRQQARLFNDPQSGANVLIASDAIGLGLNFNIRRVIFTTMEKFGKGGRSKVPVPVSLVKQIAGRAGRRNRYGVRSWVTHVTQLQRPPAAAQLQLFQLRCRSTFKRIICLLALLRRCYS
jgi:ATP-dependent RNA helicase SUPV3L1/SUV3